MCGRLALTLGYGCVGASNFARTPMKTDPPFDPNADALYDAFQARARAPRFDVAASIEGAVTWGDTLSKQLESLDIYHAWLDSFRPLPVAVVEELRQFYTVSLTYNSNAIEGNTLTQSETEMVLSQGITVAGKTLREHLEVIGHRDAMTYMEELVQLDTPLGEREIKDLHSLILRPVNGADGRDEAGLYRTLDVRAAGTNYVYPPHYRVRELMDEFDAWLRSDAATSLHPVAMASEAHFRFVSIHPFRDGNGRVARLMMNLCLLRAGYPIAVISNARRADYIESLVYGQSHDGDASQLTVLVAQACRESLVETLRLLATAGESRGRGAEFYRAMLAR